MISALFLIAGIHSITSLKTHEQPKGFFNLANTKSSSEESLKEKGHTFMSMCFLFTCIPNPLKYLKWTVFAKIANG